MSKSARCSRPSRPAASAGFFDWEPGWLPGVGWSPGQGNPNDNLTMFDWSGNALPSLNAFRAGS